MACQGLPCHGICHPALWHAMACHGPWHAMAPYGRIFVCYIYAPIQPFCLAFTSAQDCIYFRRAVKLPAAIRYIRHLSDQCRHTCSRWHPMGEIYFNYNTGGRPVCSHGQQRIQWLHLPADRPSNDESTGAGNASCSVTPELSLSQSPLGLA